ncbi:MAG: tripartite tricarboxylate transporter substrate binding protein [Bradyrhizobiaceae bacterium]|nr:tripartite tricarboxylate transporter substrate binding protein [Bradyrhizobiaceae bacterium]
MTLVRRRFLKLATGAAALPMIACGAWALDYPSRSVRLIVPFAPGGTTDVVGRQIGTWLQEKLGQTFVIESRPGAGTNVGTEMVVRASPDGYTLLLFDPAAAINATLYENLTFNFIRDIAPIICIFRTPLVLVASAALPARTLTEFIAYAKANPGKINMASAGNGTTSHLAGALFNEMAGVDMTHIPYHGGGPAIVNLLGGQVDVFFSPVAIAIAHIRADKLRALAVTGATRLDALPGTPTIAETVPGYEASYWVGLGAPKETPTGIIDKLNREISAALADPTMQARFADLGGTAVAGPPAEFRKLIGDETEKWGKLVRSANVRVE